jgi:hypothetical protein
MNYLGGSGAVPPDVGDIKRWKYLQNPGFLTLIPKKNIQFVQGLAGWPMTCLWRCGVE